MFLIQKDIALLGVAAIALALAFGVYANAPVIFAQESGVVDNLTDVVVPDTEESEPETEVAPAQDGTDLALTNIEGLIASISTLIGTAIGIITYVISTIRQRTGNRIISDDMYNKYVDAVGEIKQKSLELTDVYGQFLQERELVKFLVNGLKGTNPEIARAVDEATNKTNSTIQNEILPQINEWNRQTQAKYETLLSKKPVRS